jgi:hypothetical protein
LHPLGGLLRGQGGHWCLDGDETEHVAQERLVGADRLHIVEPGGPQRGQHGLEPGNAALAETSPGRRQHGHAGVGEKGSPELPHNLLELVQPVPIARRRPADALQALVHDGLEQFVLAVEMAVDGHRIDAEMCSQPPHGKGAQSAFIGHREGCFDDGRPAEGWAPPACAAVRVTGPSHTASPRFVELHLASVSHCLFFHS